MRKNKKLLLASVAALGALAIGVGATSTFAWFKVSTSVSGTMAGANGTATVAVNSDAVDTELNAQVHLIVGSPVGEKTGSNITLTQWKTGSSQTISAADRSKVETVVKDVAGDHARALTNSENAYLAFPLSAWLEDTTASQTQTTQDQWEAKIHNSTTDITYTFSWDSDYDPTEGGTVDNVAALAKAEVFYYLANANTSYAQASEAISAASEPAGHKLSIDVEAFVDGTHVYYSHDENAPANKLDLGYLLVRIDGAAGNYDHVITTSYTTKLVATGANFVA